MEVRWGFIGGGNVTEVKASPSAAFTQPGSRVVAVARSDKGRAEEYARANGIPRAYGSAEELCADAEVNAVYVCTPHHMHREHALAAIRAGKHVLCEKPLAITAADCATMVREAERAGVTLAVPYYRRFYPIVEKIKEIVDSGRLGKITSARIVSHNYFMPSPEEARTDRRTAWRTGVETAGGGALTENGSHVIDLLLYLLGDPVAVSAETERWEFPFEGEDVASITTRFANRAIALLEQSWCNKVGRGILAVYGTDGDATIADLEGRTIVVQVAGGGPETIEVPARAQTTHQPVVADFVRSLNGSGPVRCTGADAARTSQLIELAYRSAREGRRVEIPSLVEVR